jgi:hypothetical protein
MLKIWARSLGVLMLLVALILCVSPTYAADCTWTGVTGAERSTVGTGAIGCTFSTATQGMNLSAVQGFAVYACAASGQTIATAISLSAWVYDPWLLVWSRAPAWDLVGTTTGNRCELLGSWEVISPRGRIGYSPSAGTVSSGAIYFRLIATGRGPYDGGDLY